MAIPGINSYEKSWRVRTATMSAGHGARVGLKNVVVFLSSPHRERPKTQLKKMATNKSPNFFQVDRIPAGSTAT
jgi:hypothetical protein